MVSIQATVFALLALGKAYETQHILKSSISSKSMKKISNESLQEFSLWHTFVQTYVLEKYKTKALPLHLKDEKLIKKCEEVLFSERKGSISASKAP